MCDLAVSNSCQTENLKLVWCKDWLCDETLREYNHKVHRSLHGDANYPYIKIVKTNQHEYVLIHGFVDFHTIKQWTLMSQEVHSSSHLYCSLNVTLFLFNPINLMTITCIHKTRHSFIIIWSSTSLRSERKGRQQNLGLHRIWTRDLWVVLQALFVSITLTCVRYIASLQVLIHLPYNVKAKYVQSIKHNRYFH